MLELLSLAPAALAAVISMVIANKVVVISGGISAYLQNVAAGNTCQERWRQLLASAEKTPEDVDALGRMLEELNQENCPWVASLASALLEEAKKPREATRKARLVFAETEPCYKLPVTSPVKLRGPFVIRVRVTKEGRAHDVHLEKKTGWAEFDECLLRAFKKAWFRPEKRGDSFVEADIYVTVHVHPN